MSKCIALSDNGIETRSRMEKYCAIFLLAVITIIYSYFLYDKYYPITEGWFQDYARYIRQGQVIYRDFYCPVPPLYIWMTTLLCKITSYSTIKLRFYLQ